MRLAACARAVRDHRRRSVGRAARAGARTGSGDAGASVQSLKKAVADLEQRMIAEALQGTRNNQQQAARLLGLSRQGLINKMKRYAIAG